MGLAPQLTGRAQPAVSPGDVGDYNAVKIAILARYDINTEAYRRHFRTATRGREESFRELSIRLMDLQNKWLRECTTMAQMKEIVDLEQLLEALPIDMTAWMRDKKPKTSQEAGELADEYVQTRQAVGTVRGSDHKPPVVSQRRFYSCDRTGHFAKDCPGIKSENKQKVDTNSVMDGSKEHKNKSNNSAADSKGKSTDLSHVKCYNCGERGHIATDQEKYVL